MRVCYGFCFVDFDQYLVRVEQSATTDRWFSVPLTLVFQSHRSVHAAEPLPAPLNHPKHVRVLRSSEHMLAVSPHIETCDISGLTPFPLAPHPVTLHPVPRDEADQTGHDTGNLEKLG